jgi:hypothetical protein
VRIQSTANAITQAIVAIVGGPDGRAHDLYRGAQADKGSYRRERATNLPNIFAGSMAINICVLASLHAHLSRLHPQRFIQRHRPEIVHRNPRGQSYDLAQLVYFAHGFIQDGGDNASMRVSGRTGESFSQPETANETGSLLGVLEIQTHAFGVALAASKTVVSLQSDVAGVVSPAMLLAHTPEILS